MEDYRTELCVILAGYKKEMNNLLAQAKDSLSDEELTNFNSKATNTAKIAYLKELHHA